MNPELEQALLQSEPEGAITRRSFAYGALGLLLAGGVATRLAGYRPAGPVMPGLALDQLPAMTEVEAEAALAGPDFADADRATLLAAVRRRRTHLVRMPVFGIDNGIGAAIRVDCGLLARTVLLEADPTMVVLPIARAGRVALTPVVARDVTAGVIQTIGPTPLPPIPAGATLVLNVIVQ